MGRQLCALVIVFLLLVLSNSFAGECRSTEPVAVPCSALGGPVLVTMHPCLNPDLSNLFVCPSLENCTASGSTEPVCADCSLGSADCQLGWLCTGQDITTPCDACNAVPSGGPESDCTGLMYGTGTPYCNETSIYGYTETYHCSAVTACTGTFSVFPPAPLADCTTYPDQAACTADPGCTWYGLPAGSPPQILTINITPSQGALFAAYSCGLSYAASSGAGPPNFLYTFTIDKPDGTSAFLAAGNSPLYLCDAANCPRNSTLRVTANVSDANGWDTAEATAGIIDIPPSRPNAPLSPSFPTPLDTISAVLGGSFDPEGDTFTYSYTLTKNGALVRSGTIGPAGGPISPYSCPPSNCPDGTVFRLKVIACDNYSIDYGGATGIVWRSECSETFVDDVTVHSVADPASFGPGLLGSDFLMCVPLALLISAILIAIMYMASQAFSLAGLSAWVKMELRELMITLVIIKIITAAIVSLNAFIQAVYGTDTVYDKAVSMLNAQVIDFHKTRDILLEDYFNINKIVSFSYFMSAGIGYSSITYSEAPLSGGSSLLTAINEALGSIYLSLLFLKLEQILLMFFAKVIPAFVLPAGFVFRAFGPTRKLGAALIALSLALIIFFPLTVVLCGEIYSTFNTPSNPMALDRRGAVPDPGWPPGSNLICQKFIPIFTIIGETGWSFILCAWMQFIPVVGTAMMNVCKFIITNIVYPGIVSGFSIANSIQLHHWATAHTISDFRDPLINYALPAVARQTVVFASLSLLTILVTAVIMKQLSSLLGGEGQIYGLSRII